MRIACSIQLTKSQLAQGIAGAECIFVPDVRFTTWEPFADDRQLPWGLKVYRSLEQTRKARASQLRYRRHGLAPEVGETVRVWLPERSAPRYGYFTEQIDGETCESMYDDGTISFDNMPRHFWDTIDRLKKLGYSDLDQHLENLMFDTRRLRWVAIDFGAYSNKPPKKETAA
tara:strand:- start:21924 stop:22439 length:516 start_codon:yes stop_codon:yes gene_type:complete